MPVKEINMFEIFHNCMNFPPELEKICAVEFEDSAPPWRSDKLWQAAVSTIQYLISRHHYGLDEVKESANRINRLMDSIDEPLERLCNLMCFRCQSPCCLVADVSYDFRDLLVMHLNGKAAPAGQPRRSGREVCVYLGPEGCRIPRSQRPWICTWYICSGQKEAAGAYLLSEIQHIGVLRKQTENLFIHTVA